MLVSSYSCDLDTTFIEIHSMCSINQLIKKVNLDHILKVPKENNIQYMASDHKRANLLHRSVSTPP